MSGLSSAVDPMQLEPPTLRSICPTKAPKVWQLEKRLHRSNSAARGQIAFKFYKPVLCGSQKAAELSKKLQADHAQFFKNTVPDIFWMAKAREFKFGVCIVYEE